MKSAPVVLLSAGLYAVCFPPFECAALAWIALVPALWMLDRPTSRMRGALAGALWGAVATALVIAWLAPTLSRYYERSHVQAATLFTLVSLVSAAPYCAAAFALLAWTRPRLPRVVWLLSVPAAWTSAELLRTQFGLRSGWARLGHAAYEAETLRQLASIGGVSLVGAVIALGNAAVYAVVRAALASQKDRDGARHTAACLVAVLLVVLAGAALHAESRRTAPAIEAPQTTWLLVQAGRHDELRWKRSHAARVLQRHAEITRSGLARAAQPPDLVVWPEHAIQFGTNDPAYGPALRAFVREVGVPLLLGAPRYDARAGDVYNSAQLLQPDGGLAHYDKQRLLPFSEAQVGWAAGGEAERWRAGSRPGLFDVGSRRAGVLICFEATDSELARALVRGGATVIVNPSNDAWFEGRGGARQHLQQAVFRAIETGLPVVRVTTSGITAVILPEGTIHASLPVDTAGALLAEVPAPAAPTLYGRVGDAFAWTCVVACAAAAVAARRAR